MLLHGTKSRHSCLRIPADEDELNGASNGYLGTWFCRDTHAAIAQGYGKDGWIAEVTEPGSDDVLALPVRRLAEWHDEARDHPDPRTFYAELRARILARGKTWLAITEIDGSSPTLVCLVPEQLEVVRWLCAGDKGMEPSF